MIDQLSDRNFQKLATLLESHVGIRLPPNKRTMVEGRLRKRLRALGLGSLDEYCRIVFDQGELENEFTHLIDVVTTNKTDFFREPDHFEFLAQTAVPTLLAERRRYGEPHHLKLWSSACSTGAEPYTIAMVLMELGRAHSRLRFSVTASDISTAVLEQAVTAIYPAEMVAPVPDEMRNRYVMQARDSARREVRIVPELRRLVRFLRLNLMDTTYPVDRDMDVIFCRNVLIYFDRATQRAVLDRLCSHLRPGGYLLLGHSESAAGSGLSGMRQVAPTVLRHA
jgi:chemotaxis protein methyltransferase CheR